MGFTVLTNFKVNFNRIFRWFVLLLLKLLFTRFFLRLLLLL